MDSHYPYFVYPLIRKLQSAPPGDDALIRLRIAANVGDPEALIALLGDPEADLRGFYPSGKSLSTEDTIDSFLSKFGNQDIADTASPEFSEPIPAPASYSEEARAQAELGSESEEPEQAEEPLPEAVPQLEEHTPAESENPLEKVRLLVKNHDYEGALEIMEAIYLNNPKKSVYFADQIRFIKKMMLNETKK